MPIILLELVSSELKLYFYFFGLRWFDLQAPSPLELVIQDLNVRFRVLSKALFGTQHEFRLMKSCLAAQIRTYWVCYGNNLFVGDFLGLRRFYGTVQGDGTGDVFTIACDLFCVAICEINDDSGDAVKEYTPGYPHRAVYPGPAVHQVSHKIVLRNSNLELLHTSLNDDAHLISQCRDFVEMLPYRPTSTTDEYERLNWRMVDERLKLLGMVIVSLDL